MRILVTGANGQLGRELCRQLAPPVIALSRAQLDISDEPSVQQTLHRCRPDVVINCAAYTKVDRAEEELDRCFQVNAQAVRHLARVCQRLGARFVQISTDYVFGSDTPRHHPYCESDAPQPQGIYAYSKLAGEEEATLAEHHLIVRTCGLYGDAPQGGNFVKTMLRLGSQRDELQVVDDQRCTPSYVAHVARGVCHLIDAKAGGLYHVVNAGSATWCEFAREIFRLTNNPVQVCPITTAQFAAAAPRPRYSVLDTTKYLRTGGPELPSWQDALQEYLALSLRKAGSASNMPAVAAPLQEEL